MDGMVTLPFSCGFRSGRCAFLKRTVLISLIQRMCNIYANVPSFGGRQDWESSRLLQIADKLAWGGAGSAKSRSLAPVSFARFGRVERGALGLDANAGSQPRPGQA